MSLKQQPPPHPSLPNRPTSNDPQQGNEAALRNEVRASFRANMHEQDPAKVKGHKEAAMRALGSIYFQEAERMARVSLVSVVCVFACWCIRRQRFVRARTSPARRSVSHRALSLSLPLSPRPPSIFAGQIADS